MQSGTDEPPQFPDDVWKRQNHSSEHGNRHHYVELLVKFLYPDRKIVGKFDAVVTENHIGKVVYDAESGEIVSGRSKENMVHNPVDIKSDNKCAHYNCDDRADQMSAQLADVSPK